jgi:hypothetical protein
MLGNPKWFKRRKYSGWGLAPATWQGWVYLGVLVVIVFLVSLLAISLQTRMLYRVLIVLFAFLLILIDSIDVMIKMDKDERETAHEALAERNAAWVMSLILTGGIIFQLTFSLLRGELYVDPFVIAALFGGVIAKGISNWYYLDK